MAPDDTDDEDVLAPHDIEERLARDEVRRLDDDRYVVSPSDESSTESVASAVDALPDGTHALTAAARAESTADTLTHDGDDVVAAFEALVRWYAGLVAPDESAAAAAATLLRHSSLAVDVSVDPEE
ncbi:MAG: hypothetical protein A07HB70_01967 [uncultured archaeon A07HB70]|nr:MAG: hypothetical protein A07HB70_01967 [uncultured archaeon A07HB70]